MRTTSSVAFYCRVGKADKKGYAPLEASITINGKRSFLTLPLKEKPEVFNAKKMPKHLQRYTEEWRVRLVEAETEMMANGIPLTVENLKSVIRTGGVVTYTLSSMEKEFLNDLKHRADCPVYRKYEMVFERLLKSVGDVEVRQVTNAQMSRFYSMLCSEYKPQTSAGMFQKVRSLFKFGIANGKLIKNPCEGIRVSRGKTVISYLTEDEVEMLYNADIHNDALRRTLDVFIFQCCSGLAYIDVHNLSRDDVKQSDDGTFFIEKARKKTGTKYTAILLPMGVEVWKKYNGKLPVLTNQKMNLNLKTIEDILNFPKHLFTHLGRHTYCTTLINRGIRADVIADAVGHSSSVITRTYYAFLKSDTVIREVSSAFAK